MVNLFLNYYIDPRPKRQLELEYVLLENIQNPHIDRIYALVSTKDIRHISDQPKVQPVSFEGMPTYNNYFTLIQGVCSKNDVSIIANADMYFDTTLRRLNKFREDTAFCLTRWDVQKKGSPIFFNRPDSQDIWIIFGHIEPHIEFEIQLGKLGCDNKIAYVLDKHGFYTSNPSLSIISYHLQLSPQRNYRKSDRYKEPFKYLKPTFLR